MGEVVVARGMNDGQFQQNPLVTLGHAYWMPPVGKSLWRKRVKDGELVGIKAKTVYPPRPEAWPAGDEWPPDKVLALVQAGLLQGKSIGFLPTKVHVPDTKEAAERGWGDRVGLVIDEWLLLEYACVFLPANQDALVEAVSKGAVGAGRGTAAGARRRSWANRSAIGRRLAERDSPTDRRSRRWRRWSGRRRGRWRRWIGRPSQRGEWRNTSTGCAAGVRTSRPSAAAYLGGGGTTRARSCADSVSHTRTVKSPDAETSRVPSGLKARE